MGYSQAVLWADVLQSLLMFASVILVAAKGAAEVGGLGEVWQRATDGNRIQFWK